MKGFEKENLQNIQQLFEEKTGVSIQKQETPKSNIMKKTALAFVAVLALMTLCAFSFSRLSGLKGDDVGFDSVYMGNGVVEIKASNYSDKTLELQEQVKLVRWSTGEEVTGDATKINVESPRIKAGEEGTIIIDLSQAYDVAQLEIPLDDGDWYYFVLTNYEFVFGNDWMCSVDFAKEGTEEDAKENFEEPVERPANTYVPEYTEGGELLVEDWVWPTESKSVSAQYGPGKNGVVSEHINIAGKKGDEVYAAADAVVLETDYSSAYGFYIILDMGNGYTVQYGHLEAHLVEQGDNVEKGQVIGKMGSSGMATGPNLLFKVWEGEKTVNPLAKKE